MTKVTVPARVDVHSHFIPPAYKKALEETGHKNPDGMPAIPVSTDSSPCPSLCKDELMARAIQAWSPEAHLEMAKSVNVSKSYLSISRLAFPSAGKVPTAERLARPVLEPIS